MSTTASDVWHYKYRRSHSVKVSASLLAVDDWFSLSMLLIPNRTQPTVNSQSPYQECWTLALSILRNCGPLSLPPTLHCHPALIPGTNLSLCSEGQIWWGQSVRGAGLVPDLLGTDIYSRFFYIAHYTVSECSNVLSNFRRWNSK